MSRLLAVAIYVFEHSFLFLRCCEETCHVVQAFCWGLWRRVSVTRSVSQSGEVAENVTGQLFQPCLVEVSWHQSIMLPCMAGMPRSAPGASLLRSSSRCERSVGKEIAPGFAHLSTYVRGEDICASARSALLGRPPKQHMATTSVAQCSDRGVRADLGIGATRPYSVRSAITLRCGVQWSVELGLMLVNGLPRFVRAQFRREGGHSRSGRHAASWLGRPPL